ncbi:putative polysaccharide biosynthesis protein [Bacillus alveayuensis]|jgi:PST family polysaccharide transporter|uniref:putative polysaccharide biosynthesis protein n=1 Tax=Aeribacillus alveayuensis TaxID=279215 RepID=UPI0005D12ACC|nr:polysaccharide biosynthesis protein [Bacillus alveayuensis]
MSNKLLRGTIILTLGTYISRFLGMIYVIPFFALVGETGGALFQYGYVPYTVFLSIATMGFPLAVSKFVSKYNSIGDYKTSRRMFKSGIIFMFLTGMIAFIILYVMAPFFAQQFLVQEKLGDVTLEDVVFVIRMVSMALIVVPVMSLIRGFFQGHQSMGPTAVSQVVEQIVRIVFLLASSYFILKVWHGDLVTAVGYATFAAFVGAIGGLIVLLIYWFRRKHKLLAMQENTVPPSNIPLKQMFTELFRYAGPFVFVGLAIPLYQYIDTNTFNKAMIQIGKAENSQELLSIVNFWVNKIVMIPVSLATAFGLTLVPTITKSHTENNYSLLNTQINQTFQLLMFLVLPAAAGLSILSQPVYMLFYNENEVGGNILAAYAPIAILFSFFTVTAAILQGINKQKLAVISLVFGLIMKASVNIPLIMAFQAYGSIMATALGFSCSLLYSFAMIKRHAGYAYKQFMKRSVLMGIFTICMSIAVLAVYSVLSLFMDFRDGKMEAAMILFISVASGAGTYLYLASYSGLLQLLVGSRFKKWKQKAV